MWGRGMSGSIGGTMPRTPTVDHPPDYRLTPRLNTSGVLDSSLSPNHLYWAWRIVPCVKLVEGWMPGKITWVKVYD